MEAFLLSLRQSLNGKISPVEVEDAVNSYREYINDELNKGRSLDDIFNELGDPRLLARSVVTASKAKQGGSSSTVYSETYTDDGNNYAHASQSTFEDFKDNNTDSTKKSKFAGFLLKARRYLMLTLVAVILIAILVALFKLAYFLFFPILIVVAIIALILMLTSRR